MSTICGNQYCVKYFLDGAKTASHVKCLRQKMQRAQKKESCHRMQ
jgi:hypothetical protein